MQNFHKLYRRPRGMYYCATDRGEMVRSHVCVADLSSATSQCMIAASCPFQGHGYMYKSAFCTLSALGFPQPAHPDLAATYFLLAGKCYALRAVQDTVLCSAVS